MRILLAGTSWLCDPDRLWLGCQWARLGQKLNPGIDLLVVDSPAESGLVWPELPSLTIIRQPCNIGHLAHGGLDGWGRDTACALQYAIDNGYDYVANYDADVLYTKSVLPIFSRMVTQDLVAAGTCSGRPYTHWLEGIHFFNVRWLAARDVIGRYGWSTMHRGVFAEDQMRAAIGSKLLDLRLPGCRDEGRLTPENLRQHFPDGCTWLTHSTKPVYQELLRWYGLGESV